MDVGFLLRGLILGFSIAAPVGPIGVLCIRRTLANGRASGLVSGLGAASADAIYGSVAAFGLTVISSFLVERQTALRLVGGLFLLYLGVRTLLARPATETTVIASTSLGSDYATTFVLTLTNPMTILAFAAVFAGLGLTAGAGFGSALLLVLGVFLGSALWWLLLVTIVSLVRHRLTPTSLRWVNIASGVIITVFGLIALGSLMR